MLVIMSVMTYGIYKRNFSVQFSNSLILKSFTILYYVIETHIIMIYDLLI
jgi:hypothetical protein